jgi:hypothetical protein
MILIFMHVTGTAPARRVPDGWYQIFKRLPAPAATDLGK